MSETPALSPEETAMTAQAEFETAVAKHEVLELQVINLRDAVRYSDSAARQLETFPELHALAVAQTGILRDRLRVVQLEERAAAAPLQALYLATTAVSA